MIQYEYVEISMSDLLNDSDWEHYCHDGWWFWMQVMSTTVQDRVHSYRRELSRTIDSARCASPDWVRWSCRRRCRNWVTSCQPSSRHSLRLYCLVVHLSLWFSCSAVTKSQALTAWHVSSW